MTERSEKALDRGRDHFSIGPSALDWDGERLRIQIDETSVPHLSRIKGEVLLWPQTVTPTGLTLDSNNRHHWRPIGAAARIEVRMEKPDVQWSGHGYFDTNSGSEPIEEAFADWDWARAPLKRGAAMLYNVRRRDGSRRDWTLRIKPDGGLEEAETPPEAPLPRTMIWRIARPTRGEAPGSAKVTRTLEDTPFYARSVVQNRLFGEDVEMVHECLDGRRYGTKWVKLLLPWRMPRAQF